MNGSKASKQAAQCPKCEGDGKIHDADFSDGDSDQQMRLMQDTMRECDKCCGTGTVMKKPPDK